MLVDFIDSINGWAYLISELVVDMFWWLSSATVL
jgi:hypothetical protein